MARFLVEHGACIFAATSLEKKTPMQCCDRGLPGYFNCLKYLNGENLSWSFLLMSSTVKLICKKTLTLLHPNINSLELEARTCKWWLARENTRRLASAVKRALWKARENTRPVISAESCEPSFTRNWLKREHIYPDWLEHFARFSKPIIEVIVLRVSSFMVIVLSKFFFLCLLAQYIDLIFFLFRCTGKFWTG